MRGQYTQENTPKLVRTVDSYLPLNMTILVTLPFLALYEGLKGRGLNPDDDNVSHFQDDKKYEIGWLDILSSYPAAAVGAVEIGILNITGRMIREAAYEEPREVYRELRHAIQHPRQTMKDYARSVLYDEPRETIKSINPKNWFRDIIPFCSSKPEGDKPAAYIVFMTRPRQEEMTWSRRN